MVNQIIDKLRQGVPIEQVAADTGLSISDIEVVKNSPLVRLCQQETRQEEIE